VPVIGTRGGWGRVKSGWVIGASGASD
jgi:hypothetical protein